MKSVKLSILTIFIIIVIAIAKTINFDEGVYVSNSVTARFEIIQVENHSNSTIVTVLDSGTLRNEAVQDIQIKNENMLCFPHVWTKFPDHGESFICKGKNKYKLIEFDREKLMISNFHRNEPSVRIHVALLVGELTENSRHEGEKKLRDFFGHRSMHLEMSLWSGVYTSPCPSLLPYTDQWHSAEKVIGITMAHTRILRDFVFQCKHSLDRNVLIILENDAVCGVPSCGQRALKEAIAAEVDYLNLGWCFGEDDSSGRTVGCTHAHSFSLRGATIIEEKINECGYDFIDGQIKGLKLRNQITFALATLSEEETENQKDSWTKGLFIQKQRD